MRKVAVSMAVYTGFLACASAIVYSVAGACRRDWAAVREGLAGAVIFAGSAWYCSTVK